MLAGLQARLPDLRVSVRTPLPPDVVSARIAGADPILSGDFDFGVRMSDAMDVDPHATLSAYARLFQDWPNTLASAMKPLAGSGATLVLSDISFVSAAAGAAAGIPVVLMSSLEWAAVFESYCAGLPDAAELTARMRELYGSARRTIALTPGLPMRGLPHVSRMGPVAQRGRDRRREVLERLGVAEDVRLVLFAVGGSIPPAPRLTPCPDDVVLLGPPAWSGQDGFRCVDEAGVPFLDLLWSCDLVAAKLGYGIVAETALARRPFIGFMREGWPENAAFAEWIQARVPSEIVGDELAKASPAWFFACARRLMSAGVTGDHVNDSTAAIVDLLIDELGEAA